MSIDIYAGCAYDVKTKPALNAIYQARIDNVPLKELKSIVDHAKSMGATNHEIIERFESVDSFNQFVKDLRKAGLI